MIGPEEALERLAAETGPPGTEEVDLEHAAGRVLAETVAADRDFPPTDRSAMDGYAVRCADLAAGPAALRLAGEVRAGQPLGPLRVEPGCAVRIMTGAIVPPGADAVVMVERCVEPPGEGTVRVDDRPRPGQHVRRRGEDLGRAATVLEPGGRIEAPEIAALAAVGRARVRVHRRPAIHVLSTGDEIVGVDDRPADHQVRGSNAPMLRAQAAALGLAVTDLGNAGDAPGELDRKLAAGLDGGLLLVTGGVSAGRYDLVGPTLSRLGVRPLFHKVAIKPGKPMLAGRRGDCLVIGLPGNPLSAFTGFAVFVAPVLRKCCGLRRWRNVRLEAVLDGPLAARPGRTTYHLVRLEPEGATWRARPTSSRGSGDVLSLARADGFAITGPECTGLEPGRRVAVLPWPGFPLR